MVDTCNSYHLNSSKKLLDEDKPTNLKKYICEYPGCKKQFKGKGNLIIHKKNMFIYID